MTPALEKAMAGEELSFNDGMQLMNEENLFLLGATTGNNLRKKNSGNTNICLFLLSQLHEYLRRKLPIMCFL